MYKRNIVDKLVSIQKYRVLYPIAHFLLALLGVDVSRFAIISKSVEFQHRGIGTVIHASSYIGERVKIFQNVTLGVQIPWNDRKSNINDKRIIISEDAVICAGAKILAKDKIVVGKGSIIGANAVLTRSTGEYEIWGGIPAKYIKKRIDI